MRCVINSVPLSPQVNGRLVLEGVLRVHWGVENSIRLREFDDKRVIAARKTKNDAKADRDRKCVSLGECGIDMYHVIHHVYFDSLTFEQVYLHMYRHSTISSPSFIESYHG